jgi:hypothetical protein
MQQFRAAVNGALQETRMAPTILKTPVGLSNAAAQIGGVEVGNRGSADKGPDAAVIYVVDVMIYPC